MQRKNVQVIIISPKSTIKYIKHGPSQQTFNCSKSTIETVEKGVKYVQS